MAHYTYREYMNMFRSYQQATHKMADAMFRFLEARDTLEIARYGYNLVPMICQLVQALYDVLDTPWISDGTKCAATELLDTMEFEFERMSQCDAPLTVLGEALAAKLYERHVTEKAFAEIAPLMSGDERERIQAELENYYHNMIDVLEYVMA